MYVQSLTLRSCCSIYLLKVKVSLLVKILISRGESVSVICDLTDAYEVNPSPICNFYKCETET